MSPVNWNGGFGYIYDSYHQKLRWVSVPPISPWHSQLTYYLKASLTVISYLFWLESTLW